MPVSYDITATDGPPNAAEALPTREARAEELRSIGRAVRVLVVAFAALRILDAVGVPVDPLGTIALGLAALMVLGHVAATVIGTSRRNAVDFGGFDKIDDIAEPPRTGPAVAAGDLPAPALQRDLPLSRRIVGWVAGSATAGAVLMAALTFAAWPRIGLLGVSILEGSAAVIGGYFGFMAARLANAARTAWRQATGDAPQTQRPQRIARRGPERDGDCNSSKVGLSPCTLWQPP